MKSFKAVLCLLIIMSIGVCFNNAEAQTLKELEIFLSKKKPTPPTPQTSHHRTFWKDSWDDWEDDGFWGISYGYSKQFPMSFSFQAHRHILFVGFGLGFATNSSTYTYTSSTIDSSYYIVNINGDTTSYYSYFNRDTNYTITPKGFWVLAEPGLNFNFITLSCGIGYWWGDGQRYVSTNNVSYSIDGTSSGWILNPNIILHIPIPWTENNVHLTANVGYNFLLPSLFEDDPVERNLTKQANGWKFGLGIEFKID